VILPQHRVRIIVGTGKEGRAIRKERGTKHSLSTALQAATIGNELQSLINENAVPHRPHPRAGPNTVPLDSKTIIELGCESHIRMLLIAKMSKTSAANTPSRPDRLTSSSHHPLVSSRQCSRRIGNHSDKILPRFSRLGRRRIGCQSRRYSPVCLLPLLRVRRRVDTARNKHSNRTHSVPLRTTQLHNPANRRGR
jgi:hypothetical protein